ncbi:hypothetical protein CVT25_003659 [Psilocybe cyanescens]|uniref:Uncharacterized protein n=1 Tax=Psilocybe cyanescens TaxID=93625 RepID=A0A409WP87_PSICY|nr:hypothetical protein CVT25_003659 [Psilocybe cyanescens]
MQKDRIWRWKRKNVIEQLACDHLQASSVQFLQYDINQQALKLTANNSIFVNSNVTDLAEALKISALFKKAVNDRCKLLEIDLDGVFQEIAVASEEEIRSPQSRRRYQDQSRNHRSRHKATRILQAVETGFSVSRHPDPRFVTTI